jgi:RNA-directed DNA polymerase
MNLTITDENQVNTCQTNGFGTFSHENIIECENHVRSIQERLDRAVANDDKPTIRWLTHLLSKRSRAAKILAVHRICQVNKGRHTAGIDGIAMPTLKEERLQVMEKLLDGTDITKKPDPIRRVYIPKPNGKQRPLGIPTIHDRIVQEIIRQSIEPVCEYHFQPCSYGFRPKRSCHDAIVDLHNKLSQRGARRWIIEGDIEGCFDNIKHDHIISTLREWDIPTAITNIINNMLKAKIMEGMILTPSETGTPQGGVISPMLANVALTCLDEIMPQVCEYNGRNPMVRYADDFVIVAKDKEQAIETKSYITEYLKTTTGLKLSDEKTHITEISDGFDFLGFNIRKYKDQLLMKPSKDKVNNVKRKIRETLTSTQNPVKLIRRLNSVLIGWGNYYRHVASKKTFQNIRYALWNGTTLWCSKKHPSRPKAFWIERYYEKVNKDKWTFFYEGRKLIDIARIPVRRFIKVRSDMRVYDANASDYWEKREYVNAKNSIYGSPNLTKLFCAQKGKCDYCGQSITDEQVRETTIHKHHMRPRSEGGNWKPSNLRLLHVECHKSLHSMYSRKEMVDYMNKGIDYLRLMKSTKRGISQNENQHEQ